MTATAAARVRPFDQLRRADTVTVGAKAANLGEMLAASLPVPVGFAVDAEAYRASMDAAGVTAELREGFAAALDVAGGPQPDADLERVCGPLQDLVRKAGPSDEVRSEISLAYTGLGISAEAGPVTVAVRSSALGEDGESSSFAGVHASLTNVCGHDALIDAVTECWASALSPRALAYRAAAGVSGEPAVAVVVQLMVAAQKAGVAFTADR